MNGNSFVVFHNGKPKFRLNESLMRRQNALHNLEKIISIHQAKLDIYEAIRMETDKSKLRGYAQDLTQAEFELQKLWNFPEDARFHRFWEAPRCECPKMDNEERYGTSQSIRTLSCPLHGSDT